MASTFPFLLACGNEEEVNAKIAELQQSVTELDQAFKEEFENREVAVREVNDRAGRIESQVAGLEADKVALAQRSNTLAEQITDLQTRLDEALEPGKAETTTVSLPIGVPECDDYFREYSRCIDDKLPEAAREASRLALEVSRDAWRKVAATPAGKEALATACSAARKAVSASCGW